MLLAPTVNSYKRFVDGSWAPTRVAWSYDNRTAGFRLVGEDQSLRIECRIPGADCNPYLALAALVAAGSAGIEQRVDPAPGPRDQRDLVLQPHRDVVLSQAFRCARSSAGAPSR